MVESLNRLLAYFQINEELDGTFTRFGQGRLSNLGENFGEYFGFSYRHFTAVVRLVKDDLEVAHFEHLSAVCSASLQHDAVEEVAEVFRVHLCAI